MNLPLNSLLDRNDATENARYNMVQQQVRPWNVDGERLLDALYTVRREDFTLLHTTAWHSWTCSFP